MNRSLTYLTVLPLLSVISCDVGGQHAAEAVAQPGLRIGAASVVDAPLDTLPTVVRRVWGGPRAQFLVSPSPDGRFVSLTDWMTGDVAVRNLETGETRHVTNNPAPYDPGFAIFPRVSPDGNQIAYAWWHSERAQFELRVVDWEGSEPRTLHTAEGRIAPFDWSPDGRFILAARRGGDPYAAEIVLVATADGVITVLETLGPSRPQGAAFSPDGRFIVYDRPSEEYADQRDIFVMRLDGRQKTRIVDDSSNDYVLGWAPDGDHILFCSDRTGTPGVWLLPMSDGRPTGAPELVLPDTWGVAPVEFLPDGRYYYGVQTGAQDLYVTTLGADYNSVAVPPTLATPRRLGNTTYPAWSPDGRHLAYIRTSGVLAGKRRSLVIRSLETGEVRQFHLGDGLSPFAAPRWAPDGRSLVLVAGDASGPTGVYRVDVQTGRSEALVSERLPGGDIDLSPDGRFLYYRARVEGEDKYTVRIFRKDLSSGSVEEVYRAPVGIIRHVAVSPDGSSLAVSLQALEGLGHQILVLPARGGEARELTPLSPAIMSIAWTPDSKTILYSRQQTIGDPTDKSMAVWRVALAGGPPEPIGLEMEGNRVPASSP